MANDGGCAVAASPLKEGCTIAAVPSVAGFSGRCDGATAVYFLDENVCRAALPTPASALTPFAVAASEALVGCLEAIGTTTLDAETAPAATEMVQICLCTAPGVATIGQRGGSGRDVARVSVDCMRRAGHVISDEALAAAEAELEQQMPPRAEIPGRLIARAFVSIAAIVFTIVMIRRQKKKEKRIGA